MNNAQAERFQELLEEACDHHIEYDGGTVITRVFQTEAGGQCPLTCLFGRIGVDLMVAECNDMLDTKSVTDEELWAFIFAFDGSVTSEPDKHFVSAILIGRALRGKYITKE